jgi:pseudouridine-5'-phosphate glycosidase
VIVVSAGAKAILDIPKTLEALETRGVPVVAFGQDEMPAFWSRDSGLKLPSQAR